MKTGEGETQMSEKPKKHFEHILEDERRLVCGEIIAKAIRAMRDIGCDSSYIAASLKHAVDTLEDGAEK
jgi:hypothetical protein